MGIPRCHGSHGAVLLLLLLLPIVGRPLMCTMKDGDEIEEAEWRPARDGRPSMASGGGRWCDPIEGTLVVFFNIISQTHLHCYPHPHPHSHTTVSHLRRRPHPLTPRLATPAMKVYYHDESDEHPTADHDSTKEYLDLDALKAIHVLGFVNQCMEDVDKLAEERGYVARDEVGWLSPSPLLLLLCARVCIAMAGSCP